MRRWFRRKGKDSEKGEEQEEVRLMEEAEAGTEAEAAPQESTPEELLPAEPEPEEAEPVAAEAGAEPVSERRGLFRRWRRSAREDEAVPEAAATEPSRDQGELIPEPPPEPMAPPEPDQLAAALPTPEPEPEGEIPSPEIDVMETPPTLAEEEGAGDLELPGEVSDTIRKKRFQRLRERLQRTREAFSGRLGRLFLGRKVVDAELLEELEELLITADLGVETSLFLVQALQEKLRRRELGDVERLKAALKAEMIDLLTSPAVREVSAHPGVVMMVGVNGVGKTTSLAKLAYRDRHQSVTTLLVAGDTFRAAAVEQLEIWGERVGAPVVKQKTGADPAAVVFDGLAAALARKVDMVYVDTAGRLHTKVNLMEELKKIHRTAAKKIPGAPHEVFLVLDATTGQNALSQARLFHEAVGVTGIILTKMDGTAKGGMALAVVHETGVPIRYIGVGEAMEDLRPFNAENFVEAILE
jgi:fused signal recognition particle receptor